MKSKRSMRQSTTPRLRQKMTWQYAAAGIAVAVIVAAGIFIWLNLGNNRESKAATKQVIYSKQSGDWSKAGSWEPRAPASGDSIVLKSGHTINLDKNITLEGAKIAVYGTLWIDHSKKLTLQKESVIEVLKPSGTIDGGKADGTAENSASTWIEYEGKSLWDSRMEPVAGYSKLDKYGYNAIGTLPVTLAYFKVKPEAGKVIVEWATAAEENNDFFTVERSTDGKSFQVVGSVRGAGNSKSKLTYSFTDVSPLAGKSYYRLKQTDYDGKFEYFKLEMVESKSVQNNSVAGLTVQKVGPNPFQYDFFVDFELGADGPVEIRLMNMNGQIVLTEMMDGYAGNNRYAYNDSKGLLKGTYMLSLSHNNIATKPIRLLKN